MLVLLKLKRERLFRYTDNPLVNASPTEGGGEMMERGNDRSVCKCATVGKGAGGGGQREGEGKYMENTKMGFLIY